MLDLNLGSIFSGIEQLRCKKEREAIAVVVIGQIISGAIMFNYSLGKGLETKSPFFKWMGYCFTHVAGALLKLTLNQDIMQRFVIAAPIDLVNNRELLDSIWVCEGGKGKR